MSAKYAILKKAARIINFQKIMAQPYSKLQETFKMASDRKSTRLNSSH